MGPMPGRIESQLVPLTAVVPSRREEMLALMHQYYENVSRSTFLADLAEKQWAVMLVDPRTDALAGFSTQMLLTIDLDGRPVRALFSGDTIVSQDHWGQTALIRGWARLALDLMDRYGPVPLYWFLICKGYRTYRFLPLFFREFYPRHEGPTPAWAQRLLDALGQSKFPADYDAAAGIVRGGAQKDRLRPGVGPLTDARLRDPHVRFFALRNPGHAQGDELCCLAPLARDNITRAAGRMIGEPAVSKEPAA